MMHQPFLLRQDGALEPSELPHGACIDSLRLWNPERNGSGAARRVEVGLLLEVRLHVQPVGRVSGSVEDNQDDWHGFAQPCPQIGALESEDDHAPVRSFFQMVCCFQLQANLAILDFPVLVVSTHEEIEPIIMPVPLDCVPAQQDMALYMVHTQVGDNVLPRPPFPRDRLSLRHRESPPQDYSAERRTACSYDSQFAAHLAMSLIVDIVLSTAQLQSVPRNRRQ